MAVTQCPAVEHSSVLGDICASPPAKSPHHMVLFTHSCFQYPSDVNKRKKKTQGEHTNSVQMTQGNTVTGNAFATNSAPSPQWLVLHANQDGWACCSVISPIMAAARNPHGISLLPIFLTLSVSKQSLRCTQTVSGMSAVTELGSTVSLWSLAGR